MKFKLLIMLLSTYFILSGCGSVFRDIAGSKPTEEPPTTVVDDDTIEENDVDNQHVVESDESDQQDVEDKSVEGEYLIELNQPIADNEDFSATLVSIEKIIDEYWDEERIEVTFDVHNKTDETVTFQARDVSVDGRMVNERILYMSQDVASGKSAYAVLTIEDYNGGKLPAFETDFEMRLHVFSFENYDYENSADVRVVFD
ncbi:hypothetical protein [Amphibacillus sediminis]|uniref:hypothetical protein n=1 Tax=Amphibacillus sediminis TaxID=360185 RepID=UPI00082AD0FA|nr:hypothetical protein [Amphibacillus sediminis]